MKAFLLDQIFQAYPVLFVFGLFLFFKILFIYSLETHRERGRDTGREKQAPCGKPNTGLDPKSPGSRPELKADAQPLSHPGAPYPKSLNCGAVIEEEIIGLSLSELKYKYTERKI